MAGILDLLTGGSRDPAVAAFLSADRGLLNRLGAYMQAKSAAPIAAQRQQALQDAYTPAQDEQRISEMQAPSLLNTAAMGAARPSYSGPMRDTGGSPSMEAASAADLMPTATERVIPGRPARFDFEAAQNRLLSLGDVETAKTLAEFQEAQRKAIGSGIDWTGTLKDAVDEKGNPVLLGMTNRGPEVIKGYRPKDDAPKAPTSRTVERNGVKVTEEWDGSRFVPIATSAANPTPQSIIYDANGSAFFVDPRNPSAPPRPILMADGKPIEKPAAAGKAPTEGERTSAGYLSRMEAAEQRLGGLNPLGTKGDRVASSFAPGSDSIMKNWLMSNEGQLYQQAAMDWIRAKLRKESGAAIGQDEAEQEYRTYFPMPGDGPDKIRQKAAARKEAMKALQFSAGSAYRPNGAAAGGLITVRAPNGKVYTFPDKKSADNFKLKAGIR